MFTSTKALQVWCVACGLAMTMMGCGPKEPPADTAAPPADAAAALDATAPAANGEPREGAVPVKEQQIVKEALAKLSPEARLGARLFYDNRLGNPGANLATSCRTCHIPAEASGGARRWADSLPLSVMPATDRGSKIETLRNTPTLLDAVLDPSFPTDGAVSPIGGYLVLKLTSEHMGWRPGEEEQAKKEIHALLLNDDGTDVLAEGTYVEQYKAAKNMDITTQPPDTMLATVVASITDYLNTVKTNKAAAYDAIMFLNRMQEGLANESDTPQELSGRIFGRIANEEGRVLIRFPAVYDEEAYQGLKAFMRVIPTFSSSTNGDELNIGNCIACHVPPRFTDGKFHNVGVTQSEYDAVHGEGAFMKYTVPALSEKTRSRVDESDPEKADLGRWNVDLQESSIGAFKTPKLRDASGTNPYMHNGRYATTEEAIRAHLKAADLARAGKLRNPDPELLKISGLTEKDITNLVKFIDTLNEVDPEKYRDFRISNIRIRQDPLGEQTYEN